MPAIRAKPNERARQSLRLEQDLWAAIDDARCHRPGSVSRNTWITEAISEKLARDHNERTPSQRATAAIDV